MKDTSVHDFEIIILGVLLASWKWGGAGDGQSLASGSMNGFDSVKNLDPVAELRGEEMDEPWNAASQPSVIGGHQKSYTT